MWQSEPLQEFLNRSDGVGIRPVLRATLPIEASALDDMDTMDRRHQPRRNSDSAASRSEVSASTAAAACATLDRLDLAIVLLSSDGRVLLANPAAQRVAARGDCFRIKAHRLQLSDHHNQRVLETFLSDRTSTVTLHGGPSCLSIRDDSAHCYYLFAEWLDAPSLHGGPIASLLIYEPNLAGQFSHDLLARLYGLTKMESQLVATLFVAPVLRTAADGCGITLNTAKTHLKHVFSKCGVCSKAELLRLLALGPRTF